MGDTLPIEEEKAEQEMDDQSSMVYVERSKDVDQEFSSPDAGTQQEQPASNSNSKSNDKGEMEVLYMLTGCISEMSQKYEQMGTRFTNRLESIEKTGKNLQERFDGL